MTAKRFGSFWSSVQERLKPRQEDWETVPGSTPQGLECASQVLEMHRARRFEEYSPEWLEYERQRRERARKGHLRQGAKIAAAAERLLQKHHWRRNFEVRAGQGEFAYMPSARAAGEDTGDGHYFPETTEGCLSAVEVVQCCFSDLIGKIFHTRPRGPSTLA